MSCHHRWPFRCTLVSTCTCSVWLVCACACLRTHVCLFEYNCVHVCILMCDLKATRVRIQCQFAFNLLLSGSVHVNVYSKLCIVILSRQMQGIVTDE